MMGALRRILGVIGIGKAHTQIITISLKKGQVHKTLTAIDKTPIKETLFKDILLATLFLRHFSL
jgi:hypothetical protein